MILININCQRISLSHLRLFAGIVQLTAYYVYAALSQGANGCSTVVVVVAAAAVSPVVFLLPTRVWHTCVYGQSFGPVAKLLPSAEHKMLKKLRFLTRDSMKS